MSNINFGTRNLHIVIFSSEVSIHTRRWVLGLRDLGLKVDLITLYKDGIHDIGGINLGAVNKLDYLTKIGKLKSIINKLKPDILHAHFASSYGFLASFVNHPRKILSVWGYDIIGFPQRNLIQHGMIMKSLKSAHYITATGYFLKSVLDSMNIKETPIDIIPFGVDQNVFSYKERVSPKEIRIGIAKHLEDQYGVHVLIEAFKLLLKKHDNIRLLIAGTGGKEMRYKQLVEKYKLGDKIEFVGEIEYAEMPAFLNSLDIATMPSINDNESFGVAALEASATGLPVVATRVGGIPEVVLHGESGFLAEKKNPDQLAEYIGMLIRDPNLRRKMGIAGRKMVEQKYRWEDNLKAMHNLYEKIMV
ncbi:MAG: glycosyltransferase [Candidatus Hodarchaeales archaeon]|jgi:glycosyltransferase involved in cell wall biosynthesis